MICTVAFPKRSVPAAHVQRKGLVGLVLFMLGLAVALPTATSVAGAELSLALTPLLIELSAKPGETKTFDVVITNESKTETADFVVRVSDLAQKTNGDYRVEETVESGYSCASWITLSTNGISIGPGESAAVAGRLAVPRNTFGGRYAAVVFELVPEQKTGDALGSTTLYYRMATAVEVLISSPRTTQDVAISEFNVLFARDNASYTEAFGEKALIMAAKVRNQGNGHVFVRGTLTLRDSAERRLRQIPLGTGRGIVLPGVEINLVSVLPAGLSPGEYVADISVTYGGHRPAVAKIPFTVAPGSAAQTAHPTQATIAPFSVDPGDLDLSYPAGATATRSLVIENRSDQAIRVEGRATPLAFDEEGELVTGDVAVPAASCAQWIELKPNVAEIKPRSRQVVRMMISIPRGESGGKYANVVFTATPVSPDKGQRWSGESGAVVFLKVGKEFSTLGKVTPITMEDGGPSVGTVFGTIFENTGTIHVKPRASMTIKKRVMPESVPGIEYVGPGSLVEVNAIDLGEEENVVLPGGKRLFNVALSGGLEPGDYVVEFLVNYGGKSPLYVMREFTVK
ncbi:MAG: hypothetical protein ACOYES_07505 [Bacillota bacterium]|jgi:hypothetical protein